MNQETKQIFSIRKFKTGTHSALIAKYGIALAATAVLMGAGTVSADEVTATQTQPATEQVAPATDQAKTEEVETVKAEVKSEIPTSVPATTTQDQAVEAVDKAQDTLKSNVDAAKEAGVVVKEGDKEKVGINDSNAASKTSEVLSDLNKQDQAVKEATEKQLANQKAYEETTADHKEAVEKGEKALAESTKAVDQTVKDAKAAGLEVEETTANMTPEYKDVKGLEGEELRKVMAENIELYNLAVKSGVEVQGKSVEDLKRALEQYQANVKVFNETTKNLETVTEAGLKALDEANKKQDSIIAAAEKQGVKATSSTHNVSVSYADVKGLEGEALQKAMESNIAAYNAAVEKATTDTDSSTAEMQSKLDAYTKAMDDYNKKLADWNSGKLNSESGIKWASGTTVEASTGATRVSKDEQWPNGTAGEWASVAIQNTDGSENTDANFNNMFQLNNGSGSVIVKNTTNGDLKLTISNIKAAHAGAHDQYLVVWGANDGGIAWGVFTMFNGTGSTGNAGEGGGAGGGAISGRIIDSIKSFDWKVETTGKVASFTYNDIDNNQFITVNGINGTINKGKYITQAGNKFSSGGGDVSQGSSGVVDTNGIQYVFDTAQTITVSGTHEISNNWYPSIVAGVFGVSSEVQAPKPEQPNPITLEGVRYTVDLPEAPEAPVAPKVSVEKVTVEAPEAPEAPKAQEVDVHYYEMEKTPAPVENPTKTLPETGDGGSLLSVVGAAMMSGLGFLGIKKKED